jgi:hypothetical protein
MKRRPISFVLITAVVCFAAAGCASYSVRAINRAGGSSVTTAPIKYRGGAYAFYAGRDDTDYIGPWIGDYTGTPPLDKSTLLPSTAHVFFLDSAEDGRVLFLVFRGEIDEAGAGLQSVLSGENSAGKSNFVRDDFVVKDGSGDTYRIDDGGNIRTHQSLAEPNVTDGFAVSLKSYFDEEGEALILILSNLSDSQNQQYIRTVVLYAGLDDNGAPMWAELYSGDLGNGVATEFVLVSNRGPH